MIFIGIDPGLSGAVAVLDTLKLIDIPTLLVGKKGKREYDIQAMASIFDWVKDYKLGLPSVLVGLEFVHAMPGQGVSSMWSMGRGTGIWEGILGGLRIPYEKVTPQRWKKALMDGMPKEKGASIIVAKRLFPGVDLSLKKHHGRADALLIAEYLRRTHGPDLSQLRQLDE